MFADRIQFAFQTLQKTQARAKLNFFIDNMPIDDIQCLDVDQIGRILDLAKNSTSLKDVALEPMANDLVREANLDFARTMNKIILIHQPNERKPSSNGPSSDESTDTGGGLFNIGDVSVLEDEGENVFEREVPWFALWPLPEYNFTEMFSNFCFASLYIKPEVVTTNVAVATECIWLATQCLYTTKFTKVMRIENFRQIQRTTVAQMSHRVKDTWVQALQKIIMKNFENVGKGWFSIHETNPDTYRQGKMKKITFGRALHNARHTAHICARFSRRLLPCHRKLLSRGGGSQKFVGSGPATGAARSPSASSDKRWQFGVETSR
jgi:dynein heavy chain